MTRVRVEIDLNSVRSDGTTRVRLARASGKIKRGDMVTAFESEDGVAAHAWVDRVDEARGYAFITVNTRSMRDDDGSLDRVVVGGQNRATAQVANTHASRASRSAQPAIHMYALRGELFQ